MADSLLVNTYRPEEGLMFYNVTAHLGGAPRYVHIMPAISDEFLFAVIDVSTKPSTRTEAFVSREDVIRLRDDLNAYLGEDPATPRRLCEPLAEEPLADWERELLEAHPAPTDPAPASCTTLLDGEGDWWVEGVDGLFHTVNPDVYSGDGSTIDEIDDHFGIDPGEQPAPNPVGAVVYVTGDEGGTGHFLPVGVEVTVTEVDDFGILLVSYNDELEQYVAEADLDVSPPTGPYHIGAQVRLFNGETAIIVEDLGTQTDAFGRDHHFYTVAREDNPFPPGASTTPGAATFTAEFIDGPTGDAPWTPWDVKRLVKNLAEETS